ncbi:sulfite oxidase [Nocardioides sp. LHG3406-4]|uniref:sulfite oxidase n=1 Tax=Nocardioides sp. LHG3406-4 TaxID=2804575 RepID=UPI003CF31322
MSDGLDSLRAPGRVAAPDEGITIDELRLASRNHALPMELLRHDVTPTGSHYVLTHYDIPDVDPSTWRLDVDGAVERPLKLDLAALRAMPAQTVRVTMECAGNGRAALIPRPLSQPWLNGAVGTADWTGVPLALLLERAGVAEEATDLVLTGLDHGIERGTEQDYQRGLSLADAAASDALVVHEMNGVPLPPQHGFPVRLVVPGWYGMGNVKWLHRITVATEPFAGFQNRAYRLRQEAGDEGEPVSRIEPRALVEPPGFPDFMTRTRVVRPGPTTLRGRAWSGWAPVERVEVSTDDGTTWREAGLGPDLGRWAWRAFDIPWEAEPGEHSLRARAYDGSGRVQRLDPAWNRGGFANNADQPVLVVVPGRGS